MRSRLYRRCDAAIRKIRHIDGIIDSLFAKVKGYFATLKAKLSSVGWGRKILFILGKVIKLTSVAAMVGNTGFMVKAKIELEQAKREVNNTLNSAGMDEESASGVTNTLWGAVVNPEWARTKVKFLIYQMINLLTAILGYIAEKAAIPDKV